MHSETFLTNKGLLIDYEISLIHSNGKTIDDEKYVAETLNHPYIKIVNHTSGNKPTSDLHYKNGELSSAIVRSSHQRCSVRKGVLRNFTKCTGKHLSQSLNFNKLVGLRSATLLK